MSKLLGKRARFYIDEEAIYLQSFEMEEGMEATAVDGSVYGDDFESFEPVEVKGTFRLQARVLDTYRAPGDTSDQLSEKFFYKTLLDPATGLLRTTPALVSMIFRSAPTEGDNAIFTRGWGKMGIGSPRAGLSFIRFDMTDTGPIHYGYILRLAEVTLTDTSSVNNGPAVNVGDAVSFLRTGLHVVRFTVNAGSNISVTAKIQSDDSSAFPSPTDRLTFTAFSDRTKEWGEQAVNYGNAAEDWHRLVLTGSGTAPWSVTVGVLCVIKTG